MPSIDNQHIELKSLSEKFHRKKSFATFTYELASIEIYVKGPNENKIVLGPLSLDCTVKDIKTCIRIKEHLPIEYQVLKWDNAVLTDNVPLKSLIFSKHSDIYLTLKPIPINIVSNCTQFIIDTLTSFDTIKDLKQEIEKKKGICTELQTLAFTIYDHAYDCYGETGTLRDDDSLRFIDTDIHFNRTLLLTVSPIQIKVKSARSEPVIEVQFVPTCSVQRLKEMINHDQTREFATPALRLIFGTQELEDDKNLLYYNIQNGDEIYINSGFNSIFMFLVNGKQCIPFDMKPYYRIQDLKDEFLHFFRPRCHQWELTNQSIIIKIGNKRLNDDEEVKHYDLATFNVEYHITIYICGVSYMQRFPVHVAANAQVKAIKQLLYEYKCIVAGRLTFNGIALDDEEFLEFYGIKNKSVIQMELRETTPAISVFAHDQGRRSVCYAYAVATVIRAAERRIIGRKPPGHDVLVHELINRYGENGACTVDVLSAECPRRQLRYKKVNAIEAAEALQSKHILVGSFRLDDTQWKRFCCFFKNERTKTQIITLSDIGFCDGTKTVGHAVAIYKDGGSHWRIKNSWGSNWADGGFCKISKNAMHKFYIYDIFYYPSDLTEQDWLNWETSRTA